MSQRVPTKFCMLGRHFYPATFTECPTHSPQLPTWNVRVRTKYHTIKQPDGSMTNDWTFQQKAESAKRAGRIVVDQMFGGQEAAEAHVKKVEIWPATRYGINNRDIYRGRAE